MIVENTTRAYVWAPAEIPVRVLLDFELIERILREVMRGFGAVPKRGAEIGGILLGSRDGTGIHVRDFIPVPIEYRFGPSYLLSENDIRSFGEKFTQAKETERLNPIGFVFSKTRGELTLTPEHRELWARFFLAPEGDTEPIALLIAPSATQPARAAFFVKSGGVEPDDKPLLEFPFRRRDLDPGFTPPPRGSQRDEIAEATPPEPSMPEPPVESPRELPQPEPPTFSGYATRAAPTRNSSRTLAWIAVCLACLLIGLIGGYEGGLILAPPPATAKPGLGMAVSRNPAGFRVTWNTASPLFRGARGGLLTVSEPNSVRYVNLTAKELASGGLFYLNAAPATEFRLEITLDDGDTVTARAAARP